MYLSFSAISLELHPEKVQLIDLPAGGGFDEGFDVGFVIGSQAAGRLLFENYDHILLEDGTGVILKG
jgi:hypothetical protein